MGIQPMSVTDSLKLKLNAAFPFSVRTNSLAGDKLSKTAVVMDTGSFVYILNSETGTTGRAPSEQPRALVGISQVEI